MDFVLALLIFIFGTIIGSFLNVVILRYNTGMTIASGRSACFSCGHELRWYELVPVISFLALLGRCSECRSRISWQYPLVEAATGGLFVLAYATALSHIAAMPMAAYYAALSAAVFSVLAVIFVYDLRHKIIPDGLSVLFAALGLGRIVFFPLATGFPGTQLLDLIAGPLFFLPFFLLWYFSKGKWIGLGDGKLAWGIGWFLGLVGGASAITLGFWAGALVSLAIIGFHSLFGKGPSVGMKTEVPFAPFLILGLLLVFAFAFDPLHLSVLFSIWNI